MGKEIDTKVVEMVFDNKDFEQGVKETQKSISSLKNSITDLSDSADGTKTVEEVQKAVTAKLAILEGAVTAITTRLTNDILDRINKITSKMNELTVTPISQGFGKYEEQVESVQTIMNATGKSIDSVTKQLEKLMWYTDETSYSYSDMASNIGKFTSAGVELDDAVTAMMGIANWAGVSGANVQQASRAMYNLSQAMGTGALKLQDWMSIENANMATKEFKENLIETAKELGVLDKDTEITAYNMRESLKDGWVTADVLTKTLAKYGQYTEDLYKIHEEGIETSSEAMEIYTERYGDIMDELFEVYDKFGKESKEFQELIEKNNLTAQTAMDIISIPKAEKFNKQLEKVYEHLTETYNKFGGKSKEFAKAVQESGYTIEEAGEMIENGIDKFKMSTVALGTKSFKAAQEAKTFKDAWAATIDAVSTQWLRFWNAMFGNYEEAKTMWTDLANVMWDVFAGPVSSLADTAELIDELGTRDNVLDALSSAWDALTQAIESVKRGLLDVFPFFGDMESIAGTVYTISVRIKEWADNLDGAGFGQKLQDIRDGARNAAIVLRSLAEIIFNIGWNVLRIINAILPERETITKFLDTILGTASGIEEHTKTITDSVTKVTNVIIIAIKIIKKVLVIGIAAIGILIREAIKFLLYTLINLNQNTVWQNIIKTAETVGGAIIYVVESLWSVLSTVLPGVVKLIDGVFGFIAQLFDNEARQATIDKFTGYIEEAVNFVKRIFDGVVAALTIVARTINHLCEGIGIFISDVDVWRAALILLILTIGSTGIAIATILGKVFGGIVGIFKALFTPAGTIGKVLRKFLDGLAETINGFLAIIDAAKLKAIGAVMVAYSSSILLLSFAAMELSRIDQDVFWTAMKALSLMMGMMFAFVGLCNFILQKQTLSSFKELANNGLKEAASAIASVMNLGLIFIGLYGVINALKGMLELLAGLWDAVGGDPTQYFLILSGVAVLIAGMFAGIALFTKQVQAANKSNEISKNLPKVSLELKSVSGSMIDVGLALIGIATALTVLTFVKPENLKQAAIIMGIFGLYLGIMFIAMKSAAVQMAKMDKVSRDGSINKISTVTQYLNAMTAGIKAVSKSFIIMAGAMVAFSKVKDPENVIAPFIIASVAIITMIGVFGMALKGIQNTYEENGENLGTFDTLKKLGANGTAHSTKTVKSLGVMADHIKALGKAISGIVYAMSFLMVAMVPLAAMDPYNVGRLTADLVAIMGVIAGILGAFSFMIYKFSKSSDEVYEASSGLTIGKGGVNLSGSHSGGAMGFSAESIKKVAEAIGLVCVGVAVIAQALVPLAAIVMADQWSTVAYNTIAGSDQAIERVGALGHAVAAMAEIIGAITIMMTSIILSTKNWKNGNGLNPTAIQNVGNAILKAAAAIAIIGAVIAGIAALTFVKGGVDGLEAATASIGGILGIIGTIFTVMIAAAKNITDKDYKKNTSVATLKAIGNLFIMLGTTMAIIAASISAMMAMTMFTDTETLAVAAGYIEASIGIIAILIKVVIDSLASIINTKGNGIKTLETINNSIKVIANSFLKIGATMAIIAASIALIAFAVRDIDDPNGIVLSAMFSLFLTVGEMAVILGVLARYLSDIQNGEETIFAISVSMMAMSGAILILAFAFRQMQKLGTDVLPMTGFFAVIMGVFAAYNLIMLEMLNKLNLTNVNANRSLLLIAAQLVMFAVALDLIAPAIRSIMETVHDFGAENLHHAGNAIGGLIGLFVIVEVVLAIIANIMRVKSDPATAMLLLSTSVIAIAASVWILADAIKRLAEVDFDQVKGIVSEIAILIFVFIGALTVIGIISKYASPNILVLCAAFLFFAAAIWLCSKAIDAFHTAMYNIANDEYIRNAVDTLLADPEILKAAIATLFGILAYIAAKKFLAVLARKIGSGLLEWIGTALPKTLAKAFAGTAFEEAMAHPIRGVFATLKGELGSNVAAFGVTAYGALTTLFVALETLLASYFTADTIRRAITDDWDDDAINSQFYHKGEAIAEAIRNGTTDGLSGFDKILVDAITVGLAGIGYTDGPGLNVNDTTLNGLYAIMRNGLVETAKPMFAQGEKNINKIIEAYKSKLETEYGKTYDKWTNEQRTVWNGLINGNAVQGWKSAQEVLNDIYADYYKNVQAQEAHDARMNYLAAETNGVKVNLQNELKAIQEAGDAQAGNAKSREAAQAAEAARAQALGEQAVAITVADKNAYEATHKYKIEAKQEEAETIDDIKTKEEEAIQAHKDNADAVEGVEDALEDVVTIQDAENASIAEGNGLFAERIGLAELYQSIMSGNISQSLNNFLQGDTVGTFLRGRFSTWLTKNKNDLFSKIGFAKDSNGKPVDILGSFINMFKEGLSSEEIKNVIGDTGLNKITDVIGINIDAIKEFDIDDIWGSLGKIVSIDTDAGKDLLKDVFGIDPNQEFTIEAFTKTLLGDMEFSSLFGDDNNPLKDAVTGFNKTDLSNVQDIYDAVGSQAGDAFSDGLTDSLDYSSLLTPNADEQSAITSATEQLAQEQAEAYTEAFSSAMSAAVEKKSKGNEYGLSEEDKLKKTGINRYNDIVKEADWNNALKKTYKTYMNIAEKRMKAYENKTSEADKKKYAEYQTEYEKYKQLYDSQTEANKALREEQDAILEKQKYLNDSAKLDREIKRAEMREGIWRDRILSGWYEDGVDVVSEYEKAAERLNHLLSIQEEIQNAQMKDLENGEDQGETYDYEEMAATEEAKAAREKLKKDISAADIEINGLKKKRDYYNSLDTLTEYEKEDLKATKEELRQKQTNRNALAHQYNNLLDPSRIYGDKAVTGSGNYAKDMVEQIDDYLDKRDKAIKNGKAYTAELPYNDYLTRLYYEQRDAYNKAFYKDGRRREDATNADVAAYNKAKAAYDNFFKIVNDEGIYSVRDYFQKISDASEQELKDTAAIAYGTGEESAISTADSVDILGEKALESSNSLGSLTDNLKYLTGESGKEGTIAALNGSATTLTGSFNELKGSLPTAEDLTASLDNSSTEEVIKKANDEASKAAPANNDIYSAYDADPNAMNYNYKSGRSNSLISNFKSASDTVKETNKSTNNMAEMLTALSNAIGDKMDKILLNQAAMTSSIESMPVAPDYTSNFDDISEKIGGINNNVGIYLDGKTLVGKLTPELDRSFGKRVLAAARGGMN